MVFRARHLRYGLLLGTAFMAGVVAGPGLGLLHHALAQDSSRTDMYQLLKVFGDVLQRVRRNMSTRSMTRISSRTPSTACLRASIRTAPT